MKSRDFSFARIRISKSQEESFELIKKILDELNLQKWKIKTINEEKHFIFCRPKIFNFSLKPNKVIADVFIFSKPEGNNSVIDIYYNTMTISGTTQTNNVIDPIYNKLCQVMSNTLPKFLNMVKLTDKEIEESANELVNSDNSTENANSVADEISKLVKLKESGDLTDDEFTKMKNDLIEKM